MTNSMQRRTHKWLKSDIIMTKRMTRNQIKTNKTTTKQMTKQTHWLTHNTIQLPTHMTNTQLLGTDINTLLTHMNKQITKHMQRLTQSKTKHIANTND